MVIDSLHCMHCTRAVSLAATETNSFLILSNYRKSASAIKV